MPKSTLVLKSSITHRQAEPVDQTERLAQQQHHQVVENATEQSATTAPEAPKAGKREANQLQAAFLAANRNRSVVCFLLNGIKLVGKLRQFDQFTILLEDINGVGSLVFKHSVTTITPVVRS